MFDKIEEHEVGMEIAGKPRWWTVYQDEIPVEIVRFDFTELDERLLGFILIPAGVYNWPPLAAASLKLGQEAYEMFDEKGIKLVPYESDLGKQFELLLVASKVEG